jgi:hypothetical protein
MGRGWTQVLRRGMSKAGRRPGRSRLQFERLEARELLSFGALVQVSALTPFTNTNDVSGQSGTVYLNAEVEPRIAVDPGNPQHLVAVWQQDRWSDGGSRGIVAGTSTDGGNTWTDVPLPGVTVNSGGTFLRASDPWVTIAPNGDVYAISLPINDPTNHVNDGIYVNKSTDGGLTWSNPVALVLNSNSSLALDKEAITADPGNSNNVYAVWDELGTGGGGPTMFARTTDAGQTWSTPQVILDPSPGQTISNQVAVLPNGTLINMCVSINYTTNAETIVVVRSTDHGTSWSGPITVSSLQSVGVNDPDTGTGVRSGDIIPDIAVDHTSGNAYVVWQDGRFSNFTHDDIAISMSTNGGLNWSTPVKVNQTPTNIPAGDQSAFTATVAVSSNGTVAVAYYDFRNNTSASGLLTDRWIAFANPSQQPLSFGNEQRLTNSSFNMELAANAGGYFLGDYEGTIAGGNSFNTFGNFFAQTVSAQDPSSMFFRGVLAPNTLTLTQFTAPTASEGQLAGGALATFTDASAHPNINAYSAVVNWGDGNSDTLTAASGGIVVNGSSFNVVDTHTYAEEASGLSFSVQITDGSGTIGNNATIGVADAALAASGRTVYPVAGAPFSGVIATFTDGDPAGTASDYTAAINWGDGDTTAGYSIAPDPNVAGQFDLTATKSHPYASGAAKTINITLQDTGGSMAAVQSTADIVTHFQVNAASTATAGTAFTVTVTALDALGHVTPGYTGTVHFTSSDSKAVLPANYTFTVVDQGVHSFTATLKTAGTQSITATDTVASGVKGSKTGIVVSPAATSKFKVTAPSPVTAGVPFTFTLTAQDVYGNTTPAYTGTAHFTSTDTKAPLPANYGFVAADHGLHTFSNGATLFTAGSRFLTATDTVTASITGQQAVTVKAAAAQTIVVSGYASPTTAGTAHSFVVSAKDAFGNVATSYRGTIHFTSSDPQAALPADYTFVSSDNGRHAFSATLKTAGSQSITATDTATASITGTQSPITVSAARAVQLAVTAPTSVTHGVAFVFTVKALDAYGNVAISYRGKVHFTSSDGAAVLPANYAFTSSDAGVHSFSATLNTVGSQSLSATDTAAPGITGTQSGIQVAAAPLDHLFQELPALDDEDGLGDPLGNTETVEQVAVARTGGLGDTQARVMTDIPRRQAVPHQTDDSDSWAAIAALACVLNYSWDRRTTGSKRIGTLQGSSD